MQETTALGSRVLGLISAIRTVFPNFPMRIPVGLEILSANQENHVVDELAIFKKMPTFQWHKSCNVLSSGLRTTVFIRVARVISLLAVHFPVKISGNSGMLLTNRDNQLLGNLVIFEKLLAFWNFMVWIRKILRAKAASKWVFFYLKHFVKFY